MYKSLILSSGFHIIIIMLAVITFPFIAKKPIEVPPIVSIELIQMTSVRRKDLLKFDYKDDIKKEIEDMNKKKKKKKRTKKMKLKLKPNSISLEDKFIYTGAHRKMGHM